MLLEDYQDLYEFKAVIRDDMEIWLLLRCSLWKNDDPKDDEEEVPVKKASHADALNCAEALLEFL
jgi:hypothetical protein